LESRNREAKRFAKEIEMGVREAKKSYEKLRKAKKSEERR
jgi:hypothetical protein